MSRRERRGRCWFLWHWGRRAWKRTKGGRGRGIILSLLQRGGGLSRLFRRHWWRRARKERNSGRGRGMILSLLPRGGCLSRLFRRQASQAGGWEVKELKKVVVPVEYTDFANVFSDDEADKLSPHSMEDHYIPTEKGKQPPFEPIYSLNQAELEVLRAYTEKNLANVFIRPSTSPAGAPISFTKKKTGGLCLCVNYQGLNKITVKNWNLLLLIGGTLNPLGHAKWFTQLELTNAYHILCIKDRDE